MSNSLLLSVSRKIHKTTVERWALGITDRWCLGCWHCIGKNPSLDPSFDSNLPPTHTKRGSGWWSSYLHMGNSNPLSGSWLRPKCCWYLGSKPADWKPLLLSAFHIKDHCALATVGVPELKMEERQESAHLTSEAGQCKDVNSPTWTLAFF